MECVYFTNILHFFIICDICEIILQNFSNHAKNDLFWSIIDLMQETLLHIDKLNLSFTQHGVSSQILKEVTIALPKSGTVSLLGPSGCGKTQLARSILQLYTPTNTSIEGHMAWCEGNTCTDLLSLSDTEMNAYRGCKIGMVFQDPKQAFDPIKKCGPQVAEALLVHRAMDKALAKEEVLHLLKDLNLEDAESIYNAYPHQLSGGQLQRVAIAAAIIHRPALIIADEATSALDKANEAQILEILISYVNKYQSTLLWISHDLSLSMQMSAYFYIMEKGSIVDEGSTDTIRHSNNILTVDLLAASYMRSHSITSMATPLLTLTAVSKNYDRNNVLNNLSLTINHRERVGIAGPSGKGKSTLSKIISAIESQDQGKLTWTDVNGDNIDNVINKVQMVFQQPSHSFNPKMTMSQSIAEALSLSSKGIIKIDDILQKVGLDENVHSLFPHQLSGGQLQRMAIARALIFEPLLLILDESVTALDSITKKQILDLLDELHASSKMAYLFVSHDEELLARFCDRVIRL